MEASPSATGTRSEQACGACKRHKRRCDKALPQCSLCKRTRRTCEYSNAPRPAPELGPLRARLDELENRLHSLAVPQSTTGSSPTASNSTTQLPPSCSPDRNRERSPDKFPASLFLDIDCFIAARLPVPVPELAIPMDVLAILTQENALLDASHDYFSTVHSWMPIVSKKRMDLGFSLHKGGPDLAMLFLAMRLITSQPQRHDQNTLYLTAKGFLDRLQAHGGVSLICLQAMILVALYEYSHAIYPAAWMTIGTCARYAEILMISCGGNAVSIHQITTWTEAEERRRVWWAIFILDRLVSIGSRRPCMFQEPASDGKLPADDYAWDTGDVSGAVSHAVDVDYQVPQAHYARLCQAAIYVGRAVTCARNQRLEAKARITECLLLVDELTGFKTAMDNAVQVDESMTPISLLAPRCLTHSALFVILDLLTCPEKLSLGAGFATLSNAKDLNELALQSRSLKLVQEVSDEVHEIANAICAVSGPDGPALGEICPFILDAMYSATVSFRWLLGESGADSYRASVKNLDKALDVLGTRWRLGRTLVEMTTFYDTQLEQGVNSTNV